MENRRLIKVRKILNKIVSEKLKEGVIPSEAEVIKEFLTSVYTKDLDGPFFEPYYFKRGEDFDNDKLQLLIENLYLDLEQMYNEIQVINKKSHDDMTKFVVDYENLKYEIERLSDELKRILVLKYNKYVDCVFDTFVDLSKVDLIQTDAKVDVLDNSVTINPISSLSKKVNERVKLNISLPNYKHLYDIKTSGNIENILNDFANDLYEISVYSLSDKGIVIYCDIEFLDKNVYINQIDIDMPSKLNICANIEYSPDKQNYFTLKYKDDLILANKNRSIYFDEVDARILRFILYKFDYDTKIEENGKIIYTYKFPIKNISLYSNKYNDESVFISVPYSISHDNNKLPINKVMIEVDDVLPNGTKIDYFIAPYSEDPTWIKISPNNYDFQEAPNIIDFMNVSNNSSIVSLNKDKIFEDELPSLSVNGLKFYKIFDTDKKLKDIKIFKGLNSSFVEIMDTNKEDHVPNIVDFVPNKAEYFNIFSGNILYSCRTSNKCIIKTTINFISNTRASNFSFNVNIPCSTAVYFNGQLVKTYKSSEFDFKVKANIQLNNILQGINTLVFLSYVSSDFNYNVETSINFIDMFGKIFAKSEPIKRVSLYEMQYKTKSFEKDVYCLYDVDGKTYVVVNDDNANIRYYIEYSYVVNNIDKVLFKAVLKKEKYVNATPVLKKYCIYAL